MRGILGFFKEIFLKLQSAFCDGTREWYSDKACELHPLYACEGESRCLLIKEQVHYIFYQPLNIAKQPLVLETVHKKVILGFS